MFRFLKISGLCLVISCFFLFLPLSTLNANSQAVTMNKVSKIKLQASSELTITVPKQGIFLEELVNLRPNQIRFRLGHSEKEAVKNLQIMVTALHESGVFVIIGEEQLTVLAGEPSLVAFIWAPSQAGKWKIGLSASLSFDEPNKKSNPIIQYQEEVRVADHALPTFPQSITAFHLVSFWPLLGRLVAVMIVAVLLLTYLSTVEPVTTHPERKD